MSLDLEFQAADIHGLSDLALRVLAGRPRPGVLDDKLVVPARLEDLERPEDRFVPDERAELSQRLELGLAPLEPHVRVLDSVRKLREPGATMVIAGQQPGLFGGPLFNLYKAIHVVRLAADLEALWGTPVVPVLWNHADDHDVAEVHHVHLVTPQLDVAKVNLPGLSSGRAPISRIVLDEGRHHLGALRERVFDLLGGEPFRDTALAACFPREGESLARAWTRQFLELFGHHGLVVLEPDWIRPNLSRALADLFAADPHPALAAAAERLRATHVDVPIPPDSAALAFHVVDNRRLALRHGGDGLRYDDEPGSRRPSELAAEIVDELDGYHAGALLRPLVQDMALPVAAYVGGWGELAYHAQLTDLRTERDLPTPAFVPRLACTLTDAKLRASMRRLELSFVDHVKAARQAADAESTGATDTQAVTGDDPNAATSDLAERLRSEAAAFTAELLAHRTELAALDHTLIAPLKRTRDQVKKHIERLAAKVERVATNKRGGAHRHRRRLAAYLTPSGEPQERQLSALQFLARFGTDWLDELIASIEPLPAEHLVAHLETPPDREPRP